MHHRTIFTLNARGNMFLEVAQDYFSLGTKFMHSAINTMFTELLCVLDTKEINYEDLKSCLTPRFDRKEIGLVFDSSKTESHWYGSEIFLKIIPLLHHDSAHSILSGDFIGENQIQGELYSGFSAEIKQVNQFEYNHSSQFFIVYINNLSNNMFEKLYSKLKNFRPFCGFFDLTNQSFMKTYLSSILATTCIKHRRMILVEHEDDRDNSENINLTGYDFESCGYNVKSIQGIYFGVF